MRSPGHAYGAVRLMNWLFQADMQVNSDGRRYNVWKCYEGLEASIRAQRKETTRLTAVRPSLQQPRKKTFVHQQYAIGQLVSQSASSVSGRQLRRKSRTSGAVRNFPSFHSHSPKFPQEYAITVQEQRTEHCKSTKNRLERWSQDNISRAMLDVTMM